MTRIRPDADRDANQAAQERFPFRSTRRQGNAGAGTGRAAAPALASPAWPRRHWPCPPLQHWHRRHWPRQRYRFRGPVGQTFLRRQPRDHCAAPRWPLPPSTRVILAALGRPHQSGRLLLNPPGTSRPGLAAGTGGGTGGRDCHPHGYCHPVLGCVGVVPPGSRMSKPSGVFSNPGAVPATPVSPYCQTRARVTGSIATIRSL